MDNKMTEKMTDKYGIGIKKLMLEELKRRIEVSPNLVLANYKGLNSQEVEKLRRELGKSSSNFLVVKNSLLKKALENSAPKEIDTYIKEEVGVSFMGDVLAASKTLASFSKEHASFKLNCAILDGKLEDAGRIKTLAMLPPREVLLALALGRMKSPITGFVGVLSGLLRKFVYAINEIKNKKA